MARRAAPPFERLAVVVCDSVGCGGAPDAEAFGDAGSNTLGHIIEATGLRLPNLAALGLHRIPGLPPTDHQSDPAGAWGRMIPQAAAKDTMSGHWELMGLISERLFPTYPKGFPPEVIDAFENAIGRKVLGNRKASGTVILTELGDEQVATGFPIVYTSADSVFQVAAHEEAVPVEELYDFCTKARALLVGEHAVGRVIARPFLGESADSYARTPRRRDWALPPPEPTALDHLMAAGLVTYGVGKIHDIFAGRGLSAYTKVPDNAAGVAETCRALQEGAGDLVFTNLVDFDSLHGHRRDPAGYAEALAEFDRAVPDLLRSLGPRDCLVITADHGNDPTYRGTDHTRESVPLLVAGESVNAVNLGTRRTLADLARTVLDNFDVGAGGAGESFLGAISP